MFQNTEKFKLAVCDSVRDSKLFLLIFIPFHVFDENKEFTSNQCFLLRYKFFLHNGSFWLFPTKTIQNFRIKQNCSIWLKVRNCFRLDLT